MTAGLGLGLAASPQIRTPLTRPLSVPDEEIFRVEGCSEA